MFGSQFEIWSKKLLAHRSLAFCNNRIQDPNKRMRSLACKYIEPVMKLSVFIWPMHESVISPTISSRSWFQRVPRSTPHLWSCCAKEQRNHNQCAQSYENLQLLSSTYSPCMIIRSIHCGQFLYLSRKKDNDQTGENVWCGRDFGVRITTAFSWSLQTRDNSLFWNLNYNAFQIIGVRDHESFGLFEKLKKEGKSSSWNTFTW